MRKIKNDVLKSLVISLHECNMADVGDPEMESDMPYLAATKTYKILSKAIWSLGSDAARVYADTGSLDEALASITN